jgi:hypothetical protein
MSIFSFFFFFGLDSQKAASVVILELLRSLSSFFISIDKELFRWRSTIKIRVSIEKDRIVFDFSSKGDIDQLVLTKCPTALQTTLSALLLDSMRDNSLSLDEVLDEMRVFITTAQLANASIDTRLGTGPVFFRRDRTGRFSLLDRTGPDCPVQPFESDRTGWSGSMSDRHPRMKKNEHFSPILYRSLFYSLKWN